MSNINDIIMTDANAENMFDVDVTKMKASKQIDVKNLKSKFKNDIWYIQSTNKMASIHIRFKNEGVRNFKDGLLYLTLGVVTDGTTNYTGAEIQKLLEDKSISISLQGEFDYIDVSISCLSKYMDIAISMVGELLSKATFPEDKFEMRKLAALQMVAEYKFDPYELASEKLSQLVNIDEYKINTDKWLASIQKYTRQDLIDCYKKLFNSDDAIITATGDFSPDKFVEYINKIYDAIKDRKTEFKSGKQINTINSNDKCEYVELENPQAVVMFALPGVLKDDKDKIAIRAASKMFGGGGFNARLMKSVRVEKGLVYGIYNSLVNNDLQAYLKGTARTRPENVKDVINEIKLQCKKLYEKGFTDEELKEFKTKTASQYVFSNAHEIVAFVASQREDGVKLEDINKYLDKYLGLTLEDINKALKKIYDPSKLVFVSVGHELTNQASSKQVSPEQTSSEQVLPEQISSEQILSNQASSSNPSDKKSSKQALPDQISSDKTDDTKATKELINISEEVLSNGLKIVTIPIKSADSVVFGIGYKVGSADDGRNTIGISHFIEHMMFKRTKNINSGEGEPFTRYQERYDKYYNGWTTDEVTFYPFECNRAFLDVNLRLEAERMQNLIFDEKEIEAEKNVIIEERKMRVESHPRFKYAYEAVLRSFYLYDTHAYPTIGYIDQIKACNKQNMEEHYKKYYTPSNAFVIFIGNIKPEEAVELCKKHFGDIPSGEKIVKHRVDDPVKTGLKYNLTHYSDQITSKYLDIYYKIPLNSLNSLKKILQLQIGLGILGDGRSSLLYKELVDDKKLAHEATIDWGNLEINTTGNSPLCISVMLKNGIEFENVESSIEKIIKKYTVESLTKELFETEKQKLLDSIDNYLDQPWALVEPVLQFIVSGYDIKDMKNIRNIVKSITLEEVKSAMDIIFTQIPSVTLYSIPDKSKHNMSEDSDSETDDNTSERNMSHDMSK